MKQIKHLLTLEELSRDDIYNILYKAKELKSVGRRLDQNSAALEEGTTASSELYKNEVGQPVCLP